MARQFLTGIDLKNQKAINVASGTAATDAVNKAQLDSAVAGLSWHGAVRVASTTNITISAPGSTIDSVTMVSGNRFLAKDQTIGSEKGVYVWNGAAVPATRATDGVTGTLNAGAAFYVDEGTVNADTAWTLSTDDPITVGTTSLTFSKFGAGIAYTAGTGISTSALASNQIAIDTTVTVRKFSTNVGDGSSTSIAVVHNLGSLDVQVQLYEISTGATVDTDTVRTNTNTVTFTFATAPTASQYRALVQG